MKAYETSFQNILSGSSRYIIPIFQRHYSWKNKNWERLWNDVVELFNNGEDWKMHFMGSLVFVQDPSYPGQSSSYHVIDGQQRLLTVSLFLVSIRNFALEKGYDSLAKEIDEIYLLHPFKKGREKFRITLKHKDQKDFESAISRTEIPNGNIKDAIEFFYKKISGYSIPKGEESIRTILFIIIGKLWFVNIVLNKNENEYKIFKDLNSSGVDLSQADLIRGFIFEKVESDMQEDFDNNLWKKIEEKFEDKNKVLDTRLFSNFFRDILAKDGIELFNDDNTFKTFQDKYDSVEDVFDFTRNLHYLSELYEYIISKKQHPNPIINKHLRNIRKFTTITISPLLLKILDLYNKEIITAEEVAKSFDLITVFLLRRGICKESGKSYPQIFTNICGKIEDKVFNVLVSHFDNIGFPNNERFIFNIVNTPMKKRENIEIFLEGIENYMNNKESVNMDNIQIEHILPRTLTNDWKLELGSDFDSVYKNSLQTIGNLTLTGYNQKISNNNFQYKRKEYQRSNLSITRDIYKYEKWSEKEIKDRGMELAEMAIVIWPMPEKLI
jgi:uncharacterized protein with ParB-like and HNH nuclease domain